MSDDFEIEPMTCGYCGAIVEGDIWVWALRHNCQNMPPEMIAALKKKVGEE